MSKGGDFKYSVVAQTKYDLPGKKIILTHIRKLFLDQVVYNMRNY